MVVQFVVLRNIVHACKIGNAWARAFKRVAIATLKLEGGVEGLFLVINDNPQALSSTLAHYSPGPLSFLNPIGPWSLTSNYYVLCTVQELLQYTGAIIKHYKTPCTWEHYLHLFWGSLFLSLITKR